MTRNFLSIIIYSISLVGNLYSGSLWKELNVPQSTQQFVFVDFADSLDGVIFSRYGIYAKTSDGGISWKLDSLSNVGTISQIDYFGLGRCWITADGNKSVLYYSADCKTWVPRLLPDSLVSYRPGFATIQKLFLVGTKGIVSSEDGGMSWKSNYLINSFSYACIFFADSMIGMASFWGYSVSGETNGRVLIRTVNAGVTWDTVARGPRVYNPIKFYTPKNGYIIWQNAGIEGMSLTAGMILLGDSAKFIRSIDTWPLYSLGWIDPLSAIQYDSSPPFILGSSWKLANEGTNLFSLTLSDPTALKVIAFESVSKNSNWILTEKNRLFYSIGIPTQVNIQTENQSPSVIKLYPNYPNPFNPSTTISFSLPTRSFVSLKIFDMMGREVATVVSEELPSGVHTRTWNASGMPSGMYFYRLQAGTYMETKRLILLR